MPTAAGAGGTQHGRALLALGFSLSQVVHDYGDICQAVTELAVELNAPISTEEFQTLNRLLDTAIADAVTEHARLTAESSIAEELERSGMVAHEVRGMLNTALFAFEALKQGTVAINGSTGALLGRSLMNLRSFVDSTLSVVRIDGHQERRERILVATFLDEIVLVNGSRESRGLDFTIEPIDPQLMIEADPQLLASAVTNLLNNAFKYTHVPGRVTLRAFAAYEHLRIEVEDECGGLPERVADPSKPSGERRSVSGAGSARVSPLPARPSKPRAGTFTPAIFAARVASLSSKSRCCSTRKKATSRRREATDTRGRDHRSLRRQRNRCNTVVRPARRVGLGSRQSIRTGIYGTSGSRPTGRLAEHFQTTSGLHIRMRIRRPGATMALAMADAVSAVVRIDRLTGSTKDCCPSVVTSPTEIVRDAICREDQDVAGGWCRWPSVLQRAGAISRRAMVAGLMTIRAGSLPLEVDGWSRVDQALMSIVPLRHCSAIWSSAARDRALGGSFASRSFMVQAPDDMTVMMELFESLRFVEACRHSGRGRFDRSAWARLNLDVARRASSAVWYSRNKTVLPCERRWQARQTRVRFGDPRVSSCASVDAEWRSATAMAMWSSNRRRASA